ncbi:MAG: UbiD family decarboxylase domain-containing protein [Hyphomicrobiaceae bacterium]
MSAIDFDKFRLRCFVERLIEMGEAEVHDEPVALADMSGIIEATDKATVFRNAGPQRLEIAAAVSGSRRRLAAAFGVGEREIAREVMRRLGNPQQIVEVPGKDAPVQAAVMSGEAIDLTTLPFHLQHEHDGGVYISSGLDFTIDPATGKRNVGARRLMLRGRRHMRTNLTDSSDLKLMYLKAVERKERLPIAFVVGHHPIDFFTSGLKIPTDEFQLLATLRGAPIPMVKCVTSDILVPADAEMVIEGYIDEQGYREMDGPYGEFWGYYGAMHIDPVIHVTAITHRGDVLHQTTLHGPARLSRQEASHTTSVAAEMVSTRALREAGIEAAAIHSPPAAPIFHTMRVALKDATPDKVRTTMEALFRVKGVKNIHIVDDDVDVFDDEAMTWAMATRFDPERDVVVSLQKQVAFYADPKADPDGLVHKIAYDLTDPTSRSTQVRFARPRPPVIEARGSNAGVRQALEAGPKYFIDLMAAVGSRDGREVALELDALRESGELTRLDNGEYALMSQTPGRERVL